MLWSLIKILAFVAAVAGLTYGATQLRQLDGNLRIDFMGVEATLGPLETVAAALLLIVLVWLVFKLIGLLVATFKFLNGDETAISRYFTRNRERRGFEALSEGMMALASGEGRLAMAKASKADRYLNRPELTNLLTAQAAELAGDRRKAEATYKALLQDQRTRFVGVRGIMKQKLADGDTDTAMALAQKAFALKPRHEETQDILLRLQAEHADWAGARKTLAAKLKSGAIPRDVHKRRDAVLALSDARGVLEEGADIKAREAAIEANRLSPDLIPAAVMAARGYLEKGEKRLAMRVLKKAWEARPHPDLAAVYAEIEPDEDPQARIKRFKTLTRSTASHPETKMLMAELHISAEDFPEARRALGDLPHTDPTARTLTILAAIERGEGADDSVVRGWLTKALTAPRGPQWVCDNCHNIAGAWEPVCSNCGGFDTLAWTTPPAGEIAMPTSTEMLPLLVGRPGEGETLPEVVEDAQEVAGIDVSPESEAAETAPEPAK